MTKDEVYRWLLAHPGVTPREVEAAHPALSRATLNRWISDWTVAGKVVSIGQGSRLRHWPADLGSYLALPPSEREPAPFDSERIKKGLPVFSPVQLRQLNGSLPVLLGTVEERARSVRERLMLELSYASSRLEGNTYDLIETQVLLEYGQRADGKSAEEARMILNHRDAIRYVLDNLGDLVIDKRTLCDVHALVSNGLLPRAGDSGRVREHAVSIGMSTYTPLDNKYQIEESLNDLLDVVSKEGNPFNQSMMLLTGIAYLQPFADCNKRTGRIFANVPLLKAGYPPLSFITMDPANYTRGLLAFYERGHPNIVTAAYVDGYVKSALQYKKHISKQTVSPELMALRNRNMGFVKEYVRQVVAGAITEDQRLPDSIPPEDREEVSRWLADSLESLHEGQALLYGLDRDQLSHYLESRKIQSVKADEDEDEGFAHP